LQERDITFSEENERNAARPCGNCQVLFEDDLNAAFSPLPGKPRRSLPRSERQTAGRGARDLNALERADNAFGSLSAVMDFKRSNPRYDQ